MGFRLFSNPAAPIAINFGSSSVKLLQQSPATREGGHQPSLAAAAELTIPEPGQHTLDDLFLFYECELPRILREGRFKGRRVICSIPDSQTIVQHMQLPPQDGMKRDDVIKAQLQMQMGIAPQSAVVRSIDVADLNRAGQNRTEIICFAIPREVVMRYVALMAKFKMEVTGVYTEAMAMVRAFDHINRRKGDEHLTSLYIDLGYSGTRVAIAHGTQIAFARSIQIGGQHFDNAIMKQLGCTAAEARTHRLAMEAANQTARPTPAAPAAPPAAEADEAGDMARIAAAMAKADQDGTQPQHEPGVTVVEGERRKGVLPASLAASVNPEDTDAKAGAELDLTEPLDTIADELSMCLRYHRGLFPDRNIDRTILVGGEARQKWLCQHVVRALRLPAQLGDPLARLKSASEPINTPGLDLNHPQPGWTVACGLSATIDHE